MWANALRRVLGSRTLLHSPSFVTRSFAAGVVGALAVAGAALGATPIGSEFQVNTYTTSSQSNASVAIDAVEVFSFMLPP